jgi:hypothetical protein
MRKKIKLKINIFSRTLEAKISLNLLKNKDKSRKTLTRHATLKSSFLKENRLKEELFKVACLGNNVKNIYTY